MNNKFICFIGLCLMILFVSNELSSQNTITGNVSDEDGLTLIFANVSIKNTNIGTVTNENGDFSLKTNQDFPLIISVSYVGYATQEIEVKNSNTPLRFVLKQDGFITPELIVTANRGPGKSFDAPAPASSISGKEIQSSAQAEPLRNLINVPGVQIQQQSASRINIEMRGSAGLFGTGVFPIMDYRSLIGPGIGTFQSDAAGISNIDLARIEVVRGPGSALYGPSVTSGVVHFLTKNPIEYPGTSIQIGGGELNTLMTALRHAGKNKDKTFGYKINIGYNRGNEFTLDPNNPEDSIQIAKFKTQIIQPVITNDHVTFETEEVLLDLVDENNDGFTNPMADSWSNGFANATLEFRPQKDLSLFVSGGYNQHSSVFYNSQGEGLSQAQELWTQARVQKGKLFAQAFFVSNNGGSKKNPTYLYQTGNRTSLGRDQFEAQIQYNFDIEKLLNAEFTTGVDYRLTKSKTNHLVYGRNEMDDDYSIIGAYLQGKFTLNEKLKLFLAGRYDVFNFIDEGVFAPRAALVYKPQPKHTFRTSYNKSSSPNTALEAYIDFPLADAGPFAIWLLGNKEPINFSENPGTTLLIDGSPQVPGIGAPTQLAYGAITPSLMPIFEETITNDPIAASFWPLLEAALLNTQLTGYSEGVTVDLDGTPLSMENAGTSSVRIDNQFEIGYKGLFGKRIGVTADWYWTSSEGFTSLGTITPLVATPNLPADLQAEVTSSFTQQIKEELLAQGIPEDLAQQFGEQYGSLIGSAYGEAATQAGLNGTIGLANDIDRLPEFEKPLMAWGYRSFPDKLTYWGTDLGLEYYLKEDISLFANYSFLSQTEFDDEDLGEKGSGRSISLNQPKNKYRVGLNYAPDTGFIGSLSFQHDDAFFANYGQFEGITEAKNLVDASIGYQFDMGLTLSLAANNLFNSEYRAFVGFPKIGRRVLGKITYEF